MIVIQSSDNVTKLLGALLRYGLGQWERLGESRSSVSGPLPGCHSQGLLWGGFSVAHRVCWAGVELVLCGGQLGLRHVFPGRV